MRTSTPRGAHDAALNGSDLMASVRDTSGRVHQRNPLGEGSVCLACAITYPCPTAAGGEQLQLGPAT